METAGFYNRPSRFRVHVYDPLLRWVIRRIGWTGFGEDVHRVLVVRGRRTGRPYQRPVSICAVDGVRYLVSFYGESGWARNLRAGPEAELHVRREVERIRAVELQDEEKADFMRVLIGRYRLIARLWLKVNPRRLTADDLERVVRQFPVFRIASAEEK
jgi:deazaflavin-dependent oxidoreductase (nitroreductase family)